MRCPSHAIAGRLVTHNLSLRKEHSESNGKQVTVWGHHSPKNPFLVRLSPINSEPGLAVYLMPYLARIAPRYPARRAAAAAFKSFSIPERTTVVWGLGRAALPCPASKFRCVAMLYCFGNPIKVLREFRGLTQMALAEASGVNRVQLVTIEQGKRTGSIATLKRIAEALSVELDMIA